MKTRHIVFLVIALILTAAALVCALLSNTFVRGLNETQDKENDSVGEAVPRQARLYSSFSAWFSLSHRSSWRCPP